MNIDSRISYSIFKVPNDNFIKIDKDKNNLPETCTTPSSDIKNDMLGWLSARQREFVFNVPKQPISPEELDDGQIVDEYKQLFNRSQTTFFRNDINWQDFGEFLKEHFQTLDDVDIHCFGCSTGQEPYSLALLLKKYFDDSDFTIKASDIVADRIKGNILMQKSGILIDSFTFRKIYEALGLDVEQVKKYLLPANSKSIQINPELVNCVEFSQKNILKSLDDIDSKKKSIIMCRNMWPYIDSSKYEEFAKMLYEKLAPDSIIVLGSYDYCGEKGTLKNSDKFPEILFQCGFKPIERGAHFIHKNTPLIFEK